MSVYVTVLLSHLSTVNENVLCGSEAVKINFLTLPSA